MTTFSVRPDAPFSLSAAAGFGFGPRTGRPKPAGNQMRLAFVTDDMAHHGAVYLTQGSDGTVAGEVETDGDAEAAWRQVLRILSLDHSGAPWAGVAARDPVIGRLQGQYPGLRPVLFHSPYEAAAWASREQLAAICAAWEPFRTWSAVLLRVAGDRQGLPAAA
jgi:DNA-3-methyladenine glycosylase II